MCQQILSLPPSHSLVEGAPFLSRRFAHNWASLSNCNLQWQTAPFRISVGLQFTFPPLPPPPLCAPAAHSARCHAALTACQQRLSWRINTSSTALWTKSTNKCVMCNKAYVHGLLPLRVEVWEWEKVCRTGINRIEETKQICRREPDIEKVRKWERDRNRQREREKERKKSVWKFCVLCMWLQATVRRNSRPAETVLLKTIKCKHD